MSFRSPVLISLSILLTAVLIFHSTGCKEGDGRVAINELLGADEDAIVQLEAANATVTYSLSGYVKTEKSNLPLGNTVVDLYSGTVKIQTTHTTAEGKFFFFDLLSGFYELKVAQTSTTYVPASYYIRVLPDGTSSPASIEVLLEETVDPDESKRTYTVSGKVKNKSKPDETIPFILVELYKGDSLLQVQQTTNIGDFSFSSLASGEYRINFARDADFFQERSVAITIHDGGVIAPPVNLVFLEPKVLDVSYGIAGFVILGSSNEPLSNIKVEIWKGQMSGEPLKSTITTGEGKFIFTGLEDGLYFCRIGYGQNIYRVRTDYVIHISPDGSTSPATPNIQMSKDLSTMMKTTDITGYIKDAFSNAPIEYATIYLKGFGNVLTDRKGYFVFSGVTPGIHDLEMKKLGFEDLSTSIEVLEDDNKLITIPEQPFTYFLVYNQETDKGSIVGRIVDDNGEPLIDKVVRVYRMELQTVKYRYQSASDTYSIDTMTVWNYIDKLLITTRTGSGGEDGYDNAGTFKITHLDPTTSTSRYYVYIGEGNSKANFDTKSTNLGYTWNEPVHGGDYIHDWEYVAVTSKVSTYLTTYDPEKK